MSNKNRGQHPPPSAPAMTVIPSTYVDQYEYLVEGPIIGIRLGRRGQTHADVTMPVALFLDMVAKVQATVAAMAPAKPAGPASA